MFSAPRNAKNLSFRAVKNPTIENVISNRLMGMEGKMIVGQKAPGFTLPDTNLEPKSLRDFLSKKVVLAFYPGGFTSVCTKEICAFLWLDDLACLDCVQHRTKMVILAISPVLVQASLS